jgi:hypothetical protein
MSKVSYFILEEILLNIDHDELERIRNIHESIDHLITSNIYWKNQYKKFMKDLFDGVRFERFNNNYEKIFHFCLDILNLHKKISHFIQNLSAKDIIDLQELNLWRNELSYLPAP